MTNNIITYHCCYLYNTCWLLILGCFSIAILQVNCETRIFRVPFISRISQPWRSRENNGSRIGLFESHAF